MRLPLRPLPPTPFLMAQGALGLRPRPRPLLLACLLACLAGCVGMPAVGDADVSDPGIQANIETALRGQRGLNISAISIDVHARIVTLSGLVESYEARDAIYRTAKAARGVELVIDNLVLRE
ncbi:MAG: BON domain-containing protein [Elusimicrobia bacterium]|nr:BON domain-containing protein [Elusimicrobiota bacterium]